VKKLAGGGMGKTSRHHYLPQSRKRNNKTVRWDNDFHEKWHCLFQNLTVDEIHTFIDCINKEGDKWTRGKLTKLIKSLKRSKS